MKIEVKSVKVYHGMSEETLAFTADVWVDGKKAFYAKNDGHGGETYVQPFAREGMELRERADTWVKANVPDEVSSLQNEDGSPFTYKHDLASYIDKLVEEADNARRDKREKARIAKEDAKQKA